MTDEKIEPLTPCLACSHVEPHDRGEYEDTHERCAHETRRKHAGYDCGHKRYRKACEDENVSLGSCYTAVEHCDCSSEDKEIASLKDALSIERKARERAEGLLEIVKDCAGVPGIAGGGLCIGCRMAITTALSTDGDALVPVALTTDPFEEER